ncbi:MAG TPA: zinc-dependent alcohol dehydrogenase family protein [Gemmataceae bacterium]|nr:zinc-dependent alcohol dehydrogenase family protein [Gemmataceae bacterium]
MKAIVCERWGEPGEVLQVREVPEPVPGRGEVRVRMIASPINPSDLLMVRGQYGRQPPLPATPGFEGVGIVESGSGLLARRVMGRRVAVLNSGSGNWKEQVVIPARQAVPVPKELSVEQAATFFINPASAVVMTRYILQVPAGAWLLQTAAGSTLGRMIIRLGQRFGFRTLNVVRRREQAEELLRLGGTAAIATNDESLAERVAALTGNEGVRYALDAVGGATGSEVVRVLARGGRLIVYGTLAGEPMSVDPRTLMVGQKRIEGFWLSEWVRAQKPWTMLWLFRLIGKLMREGVLVSEAGKSFALTDIHAAVRQSELPGRQGKVLLRMNEPEA